MKPSRAVRWQGGAFSALALVTVLLSIFFTRLDSRLELGVVATLIFFLGIPHGALDTVYARRAYPIRSMSGWLVFSGVYMVMAAAVLGWWWLLPAAFLTGFLLISAFHFSGDPVNGTPLLFRLWYGGAVIVLPALLHEHEVALLFGYLVPGEFPVQSAAFLNWLAAPWLVGLVISIVKNSRHDILTSAEVTSMAWLMVVATQLIGFAVFFCAMHSARHAVRTQKFAGERSFWWVVKQSIPPMLMFSLIVAFSWNTVIAIPFDAAIVRLLFVSLAALTVPHMWLIERFRFDHAFVDNELFEVTWKNEGNASQPD